MRIMTQSRAAFRWTALYCAFWHVWIWHFPSIASVGLILDLNNSMSLGWVLLPGVVSEMINRGVTSYWPTAAKASPQGNWIKQKNLSCLTSTSPTSRHRVENDKCLFLGEFETVQCKVFDKIVPCCRQVFTELTHNTRLGPAVIRDMEVAAFYLQANSMIVKLCSGFCRSLLLCSRSTR